ncbi:GNAT family N-acetyltransferase [Amycolatopsis sp. cmx-4-61]|uniref:GNAT family N-acetyltransferase n=1 Tax=Amycolatopsis sp. cmx-4-61 TaxID=2790937 RepID=UPI00397D19EB
MRAREATEADAELLLGWRNDPRTRQASRSTTVVALDEHLAWLRGVRADPGRLLLVVDHEDEPVGTVRFDRRDGDGWEVSITVAPGHRGRGLAGAVLAEGERTARERLGVRVVLAAVHQDNAASAKLFERAGYVEAAPAVGGFRHLRKTLQ